VISTARGHLGEDRIQVDAMIAEMERTMRELKAEKEEARRAREEQQSLRRSREIEVRQLQEAKLEILRKAKDEADSMLAQAKADIAAIVKGLRQGACQTRSVVDDEARKAREALKEVSDRALPLRRSCPSGTWQPDTLTA